MAVPKRQCSRQRRRTRWANKHLVASAFTSCSNCQSTLMPHTACQECGYFRGRKVLTTRSERLVKRNALRKTPEATVTAAGQEAK